MARPVWQATSAVCPQANQHFVIRVAICYGVAPTYDRTPAAADNPPVSNEKARR